MKWERERYPRRELIGTRGRMAIGAKKDPGNVFCPQVNSIVLCDRLETFFGGEFSIKRDRSELDREVAAEDKINIE